MKTVKFLSLLVILLNFIPACSNKTATENQDNIQQPSDKGYTELGQVFTNAVYPRSAEYDNTKGYWENGEIITSWDCPDDRSFPPISPKSWDQVPVVNGRLPTFNETKTGIAIHHYGEKENPFVKPYNIMLPKLAYCYSHSSGKIELVVVIQMVHTAKDTIVGYRYITGGVGGALIGSIHFLTDSEVKKVVG